MQAPTHASKRIRRSQNTVDTETNTLFVAGKQLDGPTGVELFTTAATAKARCSLGQPFDGTTSSSGARSPIHLPLQGQSDTLRFTRMS